MVVINQLGNKAVDMTYVSSVSVLTVGPENNSSDGPHRYEVRVASGLEPSIVMYSTPALEINRETVTLVYRNLIALKAGELHGEPRTVYYIADGLSASEVFPRTSSINDIEPTFAL